MEIERSFLICATPRSGSTLVCQALKESGVAGRPEEYFEALRQSGRPRRPEQYFVGIDDHSILDHLGEREEEDETPHSPFWSRTEYERHLGWALEAGTTPNGVFAAKLMWGYFGDFVGLLRNVPRYRDLPLAELLTVVFPSLTFVRIVRASKVRQAVSLWKAVQTATWREDHDGGGIGKLDRNGAARYKGSADGDRPQLRFHYRAIAHLLDRILLEEASWDAFFEYSGIRPILVLYENFAAEPRASAANLLERMGLETPAGFRFEPAMKQQSDRINDDWVRRYSELRLGTEFDLVPVAPEPRPS